ncbi:hypothetical protein F5X68DRAFT_217549 [Plectosphaerella plurivora]|uniref:Uncharacterized protein n=1 Tax=Plectosphaerella plurivora TaxID=936078 RepID=A0A9P9A5P7_9PEZI|nr:hypothetical protein F5X68DRAFT_217549 [Plectosphaerella plurivora]
MRKEAKERINAIKRYQKRADTVCSEERPKQLYTKGQEDLERKSAKAFLTFCKTVDAVKKLIGEIAENRGILHQKVKLCLDKKISEKHEAPAPHNEWDTRSVEQRLEALCWKELYQADKVPKIQPKLAAREASPLSAEAAADGEEYIRKRIHELKEKKKEEEEKEKKHDHKDDIEYYREEIHHETDESHNAEHHHDSFYNVHHKPIHHHHHHDKKKGEETKGRKAKKIETRDVDVDADVEGDYHEGLASENVCTYFRGIAYKAKSLHRPVEQFQYENVPWLVHARGPWHHVLEGLRQIEWVLAKVGRGLHETSGFTAKEEREQVGCYYAVSSRPAPFLSVTYWNWLHGSAAR